MCRSGVKKWDGVCRGIGGIGSGFEPGDARGDVFNEVVALTKNLWCGKLGCGGGGGNGRRGGMREVSESAWCRKEGGEDVEAIMK